MTDILELAKRVEALDGPDRGVDAEIGVALGWFRSEPNKGWPDRLDYIDIRDGRCSYPGNGFYMLVPGYTASLDAAMTLVPVFDTEDGPRHADFILECTNGGLTICAMVGHNDPDKCSWGATPALALAAAALRAKEATNEQ